MTEYEQFIKSKEIVVPACGFEKSKDEMNLKLFDWQKDIVYWALKKGRTALFEDCGLGKTIQQLEWAESVCNYTKKPVLILTPLAVAAQTKREGQKFGYSVTVCRTQDDVAEGINVTNYEMLEHFDSEKFGGIVLDESSILKNYSGKMRNEIIEKFKNTPYKLSCTATPAPNDYMELGNQCEFLGIMSRTEMLATYFIHDGGDTSKWRLKGHAENKFWEWLATWAVVLTNPQELGYDGSGFVLPELVTEEIVVKSDENVIDEQYSWFSKDCMTLSERREARRNSLESRCKKAAELVANKSDEQWLVWCDLNSESEKLSSFIPGSCEVKGSDSQDYKASTMSDFSAGTVQCLISKPSIAGYGMNWQNCHNMIFVGMSDSYEMMYQAIRRCWRFGQREKVNVYIVISESEGAVKENVDRKEENSKRMIAEMVKRTKEILERDIRGTVRITNEYNPSIEMIIPEWLEAS